LIINADDFGLTVGVNRGILEAHNLGVVTSSTLMANGQAFDDAVRLAHSAPRLNVGCHIVLVDGTPLLSTTDVPTLLDPARKREDGRQFRRTLSGFARCALLGRVAAEEIQAETTAQLRRLQSAGLALSHLDSHKHVHVFPSVLYPILLAAKACGVRAIRNPFEPFHARQLLHHPGSWQRWAKLGVLGRYAARFRRAVRDAGMATPDGTFAIGVTGRLNEWLLRLILGHLPEGTWEFVCHPGYCDRDLSRIKTRLRESRERELRLLTSPATSELLVRNGIELISYRDLR
jgi:hopanoid biosynthesis associated protein HpnK